MQIFFIRLISHRHENDTQIETVQIFTLFRIFINIFFYSAPVRWHGNIIELVFQNIKIVAAKDYDILQNPKA